MLWQHAKHRLSWTKTDSHIEKWLFARQKILLQFNQISGLLPWEPQLPQEQQQFPEKLQFFCESLVDYLGLSHFKIFELLEQAYVKAVEPKQTYDPALFKSLESNTQLILNFNDKYIDLLHFQDLRKDLSRLGVLLAERSEAEAKLIRQYLRITKRHAAKDQPSLQPKPGISGRIDLRIEYKFPFKGSS